MILNHRDVFICITLINSSAWWWQAYSVLGVVMSLVGGFCSISCSLLMPSLFFAVLYWGQLCSARRVGCGALLTVGVLLVVLIVSSDVTDLFERLQRAGNAPTYL